MGITVTLERLLLFFRFLGELFFLSSREAFNEFARNPRPYLDHDLQPKVPLRAVIMGFQRSGAESLSRVLADKHGAAWISMNEHLGPKLQQKRNEMLNNVKRRTEQKTIDTITRQRNREIEEIKTSTLSFLPD